MSFVFLFFFTLGLSDPQRFARSESDRANSSMLQSIRWVTINLEILWSDSHCYYYLMNKSFPSKIKAQKLIPLKFNSAHTVFSFNPKWYVGFMGSNVIPFSLNQCYKFSLRQIYENMMRNNMAKVSYQLSRPGNNTKS